MFMNASIMPHKHTKFLLILASLVFLSCSKEKDTAPARLYHTTTSYFNWYYNANELFKETINQIESQLKFDEQGFIQVVYYLTEDESQSYDNDFGDITKKNDAVLFKHPNGKIVDECRILNGKCWYYRGNYTAALQNFNYVIENYPDCKGLGDAYFYMAQSYYQMDNRVMAENIIRQNILENDTLELTDQTFGEMGLFLVRLQMEDEAYEKAEKTLIERLEFIKNPMRQLRSTFLLAQLQAENGDFTKSLLNYQDVAKKSNDYDLAFRAKLNIAKLYLKFQKESDKNSEVYKYLVKLLKDEKNEEYRDQIYYELAMLSLKQDDRPEAIDYLTQSIQFNVSNQEQKAKSYYKIGQIYFYDYQNYPQAQAYYDSAAAVVQKTDPKYDEITRLAKTLKEYITYLNTIDYQDSMLYVASLPQEELDKIINRLAEEEQRKKEEEAQRLVEQSFSSNDPFFNQQIQNQKAQNQNNASGQWYFDNRPTVEQGKMQFQDTWGTRRNEDNWRRKNKQSFAGNFGGANGEGGAEEAVEGNAGVDSTLIKQYGDNAKYYQNIPKTEEQVAAANDKLKEAFYKLGQVYYQKLEESDSAINTFETLLDRYPDSEYTLQARYALYKLYKEEKRNLAYKAHEQYILNNHPNTVFAYLIQGKDPNDLKREVEDFEFVYTGLVESYGNKQYETSLGFSEFLLAQSEYQANEEMDIVPIQYIRGMSYGYTGEQDSLRAILTRLVADNPDHPVTPQAKATLGYLQNGVPETPTPTSATTGGATDDLTNPQNPIYKGFSQNIRAKEKIFVILYVDKSNITKEDARNKIADFNKKNFASKKLKSFVFLYQQTHWLPYIANFGTVDDAQKYIRAFQSNPVSQQIMQDGDQIMYMSHSNFKVAYGERRMEDYMKYFSNILGS